MTTNGIISSTLVHDNGDQLPVLPSQRERAGTMITTALLGGEVSRSGPQNYPWMNTGYQGSTPLVHVGSRASFPATYFTAVDSRTLSNLYSFGSMHSEDAKSFVTNRTFPMENEVAHFCRLV